VLNVPTIFAMQGGLLLVAAVLAVLAVYAAVSPPIDDARSAIGASKLARRADARVEYHDRGRGEAVVLLASLARPASDFNELVSDLNGAGFRTLAIEARGIGWSARAGVVGKWTFHDLAADVAEVLEDAGLAAAERVHVVGHAFGNRVARTFAMDYPRRVRTLTLVAAGGQAPIPLRIQGALLVATAGFLPDGFRERQMRRAFFAEGNEIPDHWNAGWNFRAGLSQIRANATTRSEEFWRGGAAPMLVLQGEEDPVAPPEAAGLALAAEFPERVTLVSIPGASHALLPERSELINEAVIAFLRDHPAR
jgi:pimeloyl-ACP methyl ester carboxylesterase